MLVAVHKAVKGGQGKLAVFGASPVLRHAFKTTKLDTVFAIEETQEAALATLAPAD